MPTPAFMKIEGSQQGLITQGAFTPDSVGNIYIEGHEDEFIVQAYRHEVNLPRDPQSGQPTGQRVHNPLIVTKVFDKSSPLLYQALVTGETLSKCELNWYRTSPTGSMERYFCTELEDAIVVSLKSTMPSCQDPNMAHFTHLEEVALAYRKITWTHIAAGTSGSDDWRVPHFL